MKQHGSSAALKMLSKTVAGLVFIAVLLLLFIDSAYAKGPVSATISGLGIEQPIELLDGAHPDLVAKLMDEMGLWYATYGPQLSPEELPDELGPAYTLTWINAGPPDKSVEERTIRQEIYLDAENGPLIHTPEQDGLQGWGPDVTGWFAAAGGLRDTLVELGVPVSPAAPSSETAPGEINPAAAPTESKPSRAPWYFGALGFALVVGLLVALGAYSMKSRVETS